MRLLLDTHVLIWWWADDRAKLGKAAARLSNPDATVLVSAASAWEIAIKHRLGKLDPGVAMDAFEDALAADGFRPIAVEMREALRAGSYAMAHTDPFDRLLAAQAELNDLTLLTRDPAFAAFPCATIWD